MENKYEFVETRERAKELGIEVPKWGRAPHIHTLNARPLKGVTTVKSIISKGEVLQQWYADNAAVAALAKPQQDIKVEYDAVQAISDKIARAQKKKELDKKYPDFAESRMAAVSSRDNAAETGTDMHAEIESYIKECLSNGGKPLSITLTDKVAPFVEWAIKNIDHFVFSEACCYSEEMWTGGIADVGFMLKNEEFIIGDFKSSREAYLDQFLQIAFYDRMLRENGGLSKQGEHLFDWKHTDGYIVFPFRSSPFKPERNDNIDGLWKAVDATILLDKLFNN
ncbi:MAG: hypothetical protein KGN01_08000 [Patescibacteria group bacterium]|nr:hypothetical protein [Patescibacteria group bacterium]